MTSTVVNLLGKYDDLRNDLICWIITYNKEVDKILHELHIVSKYNKQEKDIATDLLHIIISDDSNLDFIIPTETALNYFKDKWFGRC